MTEIDSQQWLPNDDCTSINWRGESLLIGQDDRDKPMMSITQRYDKSMVSSYQLQFLVQPLNEEVI